MQLFSIFLGLGALFGMLLISWHAPKKEVIHYLDAAAFSLFIALIGSRAVTVAVNWGYYSAHLAEIFLVWRGGLSSIGALAGGLLAVFILAWWWKLPAGMLADILFPLAGMLAIASWLGCWFGTCSYGLPSHAWWALPARDEWGVLATRVPVQLLGSVATLALVWLMDWIGRRLPGMGLSASLGLFGISGVIFALSYFRDDPVPIWHGLRLEAWGAMGLMALSATIVVVLLVRWKSRQPAARKVT